MPANPNDGTQLGTGEIISDEAMPTDTSGQRRDPSLPATAYKVPRSKIAVGPYGQDWGDASETYPLGVEDARQRRMHEFARMRDADDNRMELRNTGFTGERITLVDSRGAHFGYRGVR